MRDGASGEHGGMRIRIDVEITPRARRALTGLLLVGLTGTVANAHAGWSSDVTWIAPNEPISATKLKALFTEADERITAVEDDVAKLEAAKPVVTKNGKQWSLGATYCGITAATDGSAGGYATTKALCEQPTTGCPSASGGLGSSSAHMCTAEELVRSASSGIPLPGAGWYNRGARVIEGPSSAMTDCAGWTSNSTNMSGALWSVTPSGATCNATYPILCCD